MGYQEKDLHGARNTPGQRQPGEQLQIDSPDLTKQTPLESARSAQARFDEMVEVAKRHGTSFTYENETVEPSSGEERQIRAVLANAGWKPPIVGALQSNAIYLKGLPTQDRGPKKGENESKVNTKADSGANNGKPKMQDRRGLNGFYKGVFYRGGVPQKPKNKKTK